MEWIKWARNFDFTLLFYLVIVLFCIGSVVDFLLKRRRLITKGIYVKGTVIEYKYRFSNHKIISKIPRIRFVTEEGRTVEVNYVTKMSSFYFEVGMDVTIIYDRDEPTFCFIKEEHDNKIKPVIFLIIGGGFMILAIHHFFSN